MHCFWHRVERRRFGVHLCSVIRTLLKPHLVKLSANGAHRSGQSINDVKSNVLSGRNTISEMGHVLVEERVIKRLND